MRRASRRVTLKLFTRSMYSPERVSTLIRSPSSTNSGTFTTAPVSSVAGFSAPVRVSPFTPGSVFVMVSTTDAGRSTAIGTPSCSGDLRLGPLHQVVGASPTSARGHVDLVVGLQVHEDEVVAVGVQVLQVLALDDRQIHLHAGVERALDHGPRLHVAQLRAHERAALAGLHVLELDDLEQGAVQFQRHAVLEVVGGNAHAGQLLGRRGDRYSSIRSRDGRSQDPASVVGDLDHVLDAHTAEPGDVDRRAPR